MKAALRLAVLLGWVAAVAAPAQSPPPADEVEGVYADQNIEVGSALILSRDGPFRWYSSYGALASEGEGRWTREGPGAIRLDSDPPVVPPAFELVASERDSEPGLLVRLDEESRSASIFLHVEGEYADGTRIRERFAPDGARLAPEPGRELAAIYFVSDPFSVRSQRFPVSPGEANALTFRMIANDLGRADFRGHPVRFEPGQLSFTWLDMEL